MHVQSDPEGTKPDSFSKKQHLLEELSVFGSQELRSHYFPVCQNNWVRFPPLLCWRSSLVLFYTCIARLVFELLNQLLKFLQVFVTHRVCFGELLQHSLLIFLARFIWKNVRGNTWQHLFCYQHRCRALCLLWCETKPAVGKNPVEENPHLSLVPSTRCSCLFFFSWTAFPNPFCAWVPKNHLYLTATI